MRVLLALLSLVPVLASPPLLVNEICSNPIQILYPNEDHSRLLVNEEGLANFSRCSTGPVAIIGLVGPYHSGKSFLLNVLAEKNAFKVGPATSPQTMGIWLYGTQFRSSVDQSQIVLMDTEGFFGTDVVESYDAMTFAISALLSTHLVYNSIKLIDQAAVEYLELLALRTQLYNVRFQLQQTNLPLASAFPPLTWVVKDFIQDLGDKSSVEWLREFMDAKRDTAQPLGLASIFPEVDCRTLFLPASSLQDLRDLSVVPVERWTPEFSAGVQDLRIRLFAATSRRVGTEPMTAASLASLLRFLTSVSAENFPRLPSVWTAWIANLTQHAKTDSLKLLDQLVEQRVTGAADPLGSAQFETAMDGIAKAVVDFYKKLLFDLDELHSTSLSLLEGLVNGTRKRVKLENGARIEARINKERDDLLFNYGQQLHKVSLPKARTALQALCITLRQESEASFKRNLSAYETDKTFAPALNKLIADAEAKCSKRVSENSRAIEDLLADSVNQVTRDYKSLFEEARPSGKKLSKSEFEHVAKQVQQQSANQLEKLVRPTAWLLEETEYKSSLAQLDRLLGPQRKELEELNQAAVKKELSRAAQQQVEALKAFKLEPFPDTPSIITKKLSHESGEMLRRLKATADRFEYPQLTQEILATTGTQVEAFAAETSKANKDLFEEFFGASTRHCIRVKLREAQSKCHPLCLEYFMPGAAYHRFVTDGHACLAEVEKKKKARVPPGVLEELLPLWWEEEGSSQSLLYVIITALMGAVVVLFVRLRSK